MATRQEFLGSDVLTTAPDMTRELANQRPSFDDFVADLTEAAYPIALRHKGGERWVDLELDLWRAMAQTVKKWEQHRYLLLS